MRRLLSAVALFALFALPLSAGTVRVRLWWQHPPGEIRLLGGGQAEWRSCPACTPHPLVSAEIKAANDHVLLSGAPLRRILLRGTYDIGADATTVHLGWPAELRAARGRLLITVNLPLEEYIAGVLAGEAGGIRQPEALNAMAVAARTYAVHFRSRHAAEGFDFCDTTHCQDLRLSTISQRVRDAVARTEGELVWYQGKPAATYYHRSCGGTIEDGQALEPAHAPTPAYLRAHQDSYCIRAGGDEWRGEVSKHDLQSALRRAGLPTPPRIVEISIASRSPGGRVQSLRLADGSSATTVAAGSLRLAVGRTLGWDLIRSDAYQITDLGDRLVFSGRGQGHGVGLCQAGASVMADDGHNYREILRYYFPGTSVGINAQGLNWTMLGDERLEMLTMAPEQDRHLLGTASRVLREVEQRTGWTMLQRPQIRVYPTVDAFRDSTGEPGWVAASTRGRIVRLQPLQLLRETFASTLLHEFAHIVVEAHAHAGLPLWFREGAVLWIAEGRVNAQPLTLTLTGLEDAMHAPKSERQLRIAYAQCHARVSELAVQYGDAKVLSWVENGLPAGLMLAGRQP